MKRSHRQPLKHKDVRPFTVYLPEELDLWLRQEADVHGRTLTSQTVRVLQAGKRALEPTEEQVA